MQLQKTHLAASLALKQNQLERWPVEFSSGRDDAVVASAKAIPIVRVSKGR